MESGRYRVGWRLGVPVELGELSTLVGPDYVDSVSAVTSRASSRTPEEWAAVFNASAPRWARRLTGAPDGVAELVVGCGEGWVRLEEADSLITTQYVCQVGDGRVSFGFFVRYERRAAAWVWPPMSQLHRRVAVSTLRRAVAS
jgi:hypothetical protein